MALHPTAEKIQGKFPEAFVSSKEWRGDLAVMIKKEAIVPVCRFLHDDAEMNFDYIVHVSSVDYPEDAERFEVVYEFYSIRRRRRIRIKARVTEEDCVLDSVTGIWKGADFMEREVFDMMGIRFNNHPDHRRILMPDEYDEGYPLRKDFPLAGKGWRDTFEFITEGSHKKTT
ncbi:MAG: NADH-quinone oxidoreductase subunit C [Nitrospirae bacterium]|nr:NADH-quinone oxidoreductase subunit C [Nitrospirota bacterium]